jgi:hypothetical protein
MNRKLLLISILAVLMMVTISYATAINIKTSEIATKGSPLYSIRTKKAIGEKISDIIDSVKTKFLGDRIFLIPLFQTAELENGRAPFYKCLGATSQFYFSFRNSQYFTCFDTLQNCCSATTEP